MRCLFVLVHKPRIASDVSGQYRRQPALDPDWPLLHHGPQSNLQHMVRQIRRQSQTGFDGLPRLMSVLGTFETGQSAQRMSVSGVRPEASGERSKRRDCPDLTFTVRSLPACYVIGTTHSPDALRGSMRRRAFIKLVGGVAAAGWSLAAHGQPSAPYRVGHLAIAAPTDSPPPPPINSDAFVQGP